MEIIQNLLINNQFASGGLLLAALGSVAYFLRDLPWTLWNWIQRYTIFRVEINNNDPCYHWIAAWMARHKDLTRANSMTALTKWYSIGEVGHTHGRDTQEYSRPQIRYIPAPGWYIIKYQSRFVLVRRIKDDKTPENDRRAPRGANDAIRETITLTGSVCARQAIYQLLDEARQAMIPSDDKIDLYRTGYDNWDLMAPIQGRPLSSVITTNHAGEEMLADIRTFKQNRDWYVRCNIPYRRGYLLYGPPGNGKSSLVRAIATEIKLAVGLINLANSELSDQDLLDLCNKSMNNMIVLIEDIDCIFQQRQKEEGSAKLSFSGLLNALDGIATSEGRIIVMTTNHIEKLDPALIRPGRIDRKFYIGPATPDMAIALYQIFFPNATQQQQQNFAASVPEGTAMAALQLHLMQFKDDADAAARFVPIADLYTEE